MNEHLLANYGQNRYAGNRGGFRMVDAPAAAEQPNAAQQKAAKEQADKKASQAREGNGQTKQDQNGETEEQKAEKEAKKKHEEKPVAETLEEDERARKGTRDFAKITVKDKDVKTLIAYGPAEAAEKPPEASKEAPLEFAQRVFKQLPNNENIRGVLKIFAEAAQAAEARDLSELNTGFLVAHYLVLRHMDAVDRGLDTEDTLNTSPFLKPLENELSNRGLLIPKVVEEGEVQLDTAVAEKYSGYKDYLKKEQDKKKRKQYRKTLIESPSATTPSGIYYADIKNPALHKKCEGLNESLAGYKKDNYEGQIGELANSIPQFDGILGFGGEADTIKKRIQNRINFLQREQREVAKRLAVEEQTEFVEKVRGKNEISRIPLMGGGRIDDTGYADARIQTLAQAINYQIDQLRGSPYTPGVPDTGEQLEMLNARYGEVATATTAGGVTAEADRQRLLNEISAAIARTRVRESEQYEKRQLQEQDRYAQHSQYGERRLTSDQRRKLRQDIAQFAFNSTPGLDRRQVFPDPNDPNTSLVLDEENRIPVTPGGYADFLFNRMFDRMEGRLLEDWNAFGSAGSIEKEEFTAVLNQMSTREGVIALIGEGVLNEDLENQPERIQIIIDRARSLREKYDAEFAIRELLHNTYFIAETGGDFKDFAGYTSRFLSLYADQAFKDAPEVETALRVREQVLYQIKEEHNGYIPPELISFDPITGKSEWEDRTVKILRALNRKGVFGGTGPNGEKEAWKINRAISLSRGLGMVYLRFPEIIAECYLHAPPATWQSQSSVPWEKLVWDLNPLDHKVKRYGWGKDYRAILYAAAHRQKKGMWSQKELADALALDSIATLGTTGDQRIIDFQNFWKTGGPFTHTGWRPYISALDADRDNLRPMLKQNPGMAMHILFNKYENLDLNEARYKEVFKNKDLNEQQKLAKWHQLQAEEKQNHKGEKAWEKKEREMWLASADRIPHVVLRILSEPVNRFKLPKSREAIYQEVFGRKPTPEQIRHLTEDLAIAKEHLMKRRREHPNSFEDRLIEEDFQKIGNADRERHAKAFQKTVKDMLTAKDGGRAHEGENKLMDAVLERAHDDNFSFAITTEDVPWSEFRFGQTGGRGYFTRKINDAFSIAEADTELEFLIKHISNFRSPEEIIGQMQKIFDKAEIYSKEHAKETLKTLSIGLIRFYEKDGITKIPIIGEGIGLLNAIRRRGNSYAQTAYGAKAMEWDSDDIYNFTEQLRQILDRDQVDDIRKETGGTLLHAIGKKTKTALYLLLSVLIYEFVVKVATEK